ncbi:MAG: transglycosylase domain-containing protein [Bacteroidales bacterium]|nr:transglycosylase domain-containing protein [Bacteroidales bacterium]
MQNKGKLTKKNAVNKNKLYVKRMWATYGIFLGLVILFFTLLSFGVLGFMPSFEELENPNCNLASEVFSDDGQLLGYIGIQNRTNVDYKDLSPSLLNALKATEDVRFESHSGIDTRSLFRVLIKTVIGRQHSGGGSTITQQLAKNLFPREKVSKFSTPYFKLKEWVVAVKLERRYSKQEIISMYLNTVDYGSNSFGIKTAANTFFSKLPSQLEVQESAVLVGLLKAPTTYNPIRHKEKSMERRNVVLSQMNKYGYLSDEEYEKASQTDLITHYNPTTQDQGVATYFREKVRLFMHKWCKTHYKSNGEPYDVYRDGLRIYTTINYDMQKNAELAVRKHFTQLQSEFFKQCKGRKGAPFTGISQENIDKYLDQAMKSSDRYNNMIKEGASEREIKEAFNTPIDMDVFSWNGEIDTMMAPMDSIKYYKYFLNTGMVSIEPQTGHVKVYVGGIDYKHFKFDNATLGRRQIGSTFKPFVYASAMKDSEITPCFQIENSPVTFPEYDDWTPRNSSHAREGEMVNLKWALANSVNFVSAALMKDYTSPSSVIALVRNMGITNPIQPVPSICLGTPDLTVWEMAGAMATFVNQGVHKEPIFITKITDNKGMVLESFTSKSNTALDEKTAYLVVDLMKGVVDGGTGSRLRYKYGIKSTMAGKTGTTDNNSDGWFIGLNPKLATAVWVGGEYRSIHFSSMVWGQGAAMALPVYGYFMAECEKNQNLSFYKGGFVRPTDLEFDDNCNAKSDSDGETSPKDTINVGTFREYNENW